MSNTECPPLPAASIDLNALTAALAKGETAEGAIAKATELPEHVAAAKAAEAAAQKAAETKTPAKAADKAADSE